MSVISWLSFGGSAASTELPDIFPMSIAAPEFIKVDTVNTYLKILTDVLERTHGIAEKNSPLLWDNCLKSESSDGLVTRLAKAMATKEDLFLVYNKAVGVIRPATHDERTKIEADYKTKGSSTVGVFISFKNYERTDLVRLYASLEYCTIAALNKSMNLSKAVQYKMSDLRASTGLNDAAEVKAQALAIATALSLGKDVLTDAKDLIHTHAPDLVAVKESLEFMAQKRSYYLGMPASYITGEAPKGLGDSGDGDAKAVERGLKNYFFSIVRPVLEAIFGGKYKFKSQDYQGITSALEALKTFELTSETIISADNKNKIINKLFDLEETDKGDPGAEKEPEAAPAPKPGDK